MPSRVAVPPLVLVDVDVVLDVLARREPFFADSSSVLAACETGRCRGLIAAHTVATLSYLLGKHLGAKRANARVADLLRIVRIAAVDERVIRHALASDLSDFEDSVQMAAAALSGAEYLVTRNLAHFSAGPVPALAPAEFLPLLEADS